MYSVQCHFCSRSNPADAKFCSGCLVQLNLTPCPYCDEVNERSALVCHACRGELLQGSVGRVSGRTDLPGIDAAHTGIDSRSQVATRSSASGRLVGSTRERPADDEGAVSSYVEHIERSKRQAVFPTPAAHSGRQLRMIGERERHNVMAGRKHMTPVRPPRTILSSTAAFFDRRRLVTAAVIGFLLAIGLVFAPTDRRVHLTVPFSGASLEKGANSTESDALSERTVSVEGEYVPAILSGQRGPLPPVSAPAQTRVLAERESTSNAPFVEVTARVTPGDAFPVVSKTVEPVPGRLNVPSSAMHGPTSGLANRAPVCTSGVIALGLCPSEPVEALRSTPMKPATDVARAPVTDYASGRCKKAAFALGLCGD